MNRQRWLFSPAVDLTVFLGSAAIALLIVLWAYTAGVLDSETPQWLWVTAILLIDVAHVWATIYRVYIDGGELRRRPWLYVGLPPLLWLAGVVIYGCFGALAFWRILAYAAVFHFVRQQYGWVALYRTRCRLAPGLDAWIDVCAVYAATLYPLLFWHAHLPRSFDWFVPGDFIAISHWLAAAAEPLYWSIIFGFCVRSGYGWIVHGRGCVGRDVVIATTAICWYVGIVATNSDVAFTATNVIIHGVPYFALTYFYGRKRVDTGHGGKVLRAVLRGGPLVFVATLWLLAYGEELLWDRVVWHEREWLFGAAWHALDPLLPFIVPLLVVPQATHYVLDGFVWRRRQNPELVSIFHPDSASVGRHRVAR